MVVQLYEEWECYLPVIHILTGSTLMAQVNWPL